MKTPARFIAGIFLALAIIFAGYLANRRNDPFTSAASVEKAVKYVCPMHPQYSSEHASKCPACGMSLVPNSLGTSSAEGATAGGGHPETVLVSADNEKPVKELVCGMDVDPNSPSVLKTQYKGQTYYFCSEMCKKSFEANPEKYVHKVADPDMHGVQTTE